MDNLETIMQDRELVKRAVKEWLKLHHCPSHFNLEETPCMDSGNCQDCWTEALKNG